MTTPPQPLRFMAQQREQHTSQHASRVLQSAELLHTAKAKARQLLEQAQQRADAMVQAASQEADAIREQAQKEGYDAGFDAGWQEGLEQSEQRAQQTVAETMHTLQKAYHELMALRQDIVTQSEEDLIKFAVLIAEKIVRTQLA